MAQKKKKAAADNPAQNLSEPSNLATQLDDIDQRLIQIIRLNPAITDRELSEQFKLTRPTINARRRRPVFKLVLHRLIEEQAKDAIELLKDAIPVAVRTLLSIARSARAGDSARVSACRTILDKTLPTKVEGLIKSEIVKGAARKIPLRRCIRS